MKAFAFDMKCRYGNHVSEVMNHLTLSQWSVYILGRWTGREYKQILANSSCLMGPTVGWKSYKWQKWALGEAGAGKMILLSRDASLTTSRSVLNALQTSRSSSAPRWSVCFGKGKGWNSEDF